jgi:tetratricopeptide (TPR) repeat protein
MRLVKKFSLTLVLVICFGLADGQTVSPSAPRLGVPTVADWRSDIDSIAADIRLFHPDPFAKTGKLTFLREVEAFKAAVPSLTDEQRMVRAMRLVALVGDGHTQLEPNNPRFASWYPFRLYQFTDGFFITSAHQSVADLAGAEMLEIAGRPTAEVVGEARSLMGADNSFDRRERLFAVHNAALMKGLGYATPAGDLKIKVRLHDGRTVERQVHPRKSDDPRYDDLDSSFEWQFRGEMFGMPFGTIEEWVSAYNNLPASAFRMPDTARPLHLTQRRAYVSRPIPEHDALYAQMNQLDDTDFVKFVQSVLSEVDKQKPRRLILDLRYNFGGDGSQVQRAIHEFIRRENDQPWRELYILTGRKTFSAGIMLLDGFLKHTQVTVVGEPAGAALNFSGDTVSRPYSRSGSHMSVSSLRHQLSSSDDLREYTPVDVPTLFSFADYAAGRDPAIDPILSGEEMRSIPVIAAIDGGAAARKAYETRRTRFAQYDWWELPQEITLREICQSLQDHNRTADALETCRLNSEIHPDDWHVWYNLGHVQTAAGLKEEGLASYRRVLEVDPENFNGDELRKALAEGKK